MKHIIAIFVCFLSYNLFAQNFNWAKATNSGLMYSSTADKYGNVYVTGSFNNTIDLDPSLNTFSLSANNLSNDVFVAKYRNTGDFVWGFKIGGSDQEIGKKIAVDNLGNVFVMGSFQGLVDFNPNGGVDTIRSPGSSTDIFIAKYDSVGNYQWVNHITNQNTGANNYGACKEIHIDNNNDIILTGNLNGGLWFSDGATYSYLDELSLNDEVYFAKYQNNGGFLFANGIGGSGWDYAGCVGTDSLNNIYVTGRYQYDIDLDPSTNTAILTHTNVSNADNIFLAKYTPAGNYVYGKTILSPNTYSASALDNALFVEKNGNVYVTGQLDASSFDFDPSANTVSISGYYDCYFAKYDMNGNYVWAYKIGGSYGEAGKDISVDSLGNVFLLGNFTGTVDFNPGAGVANMTSTAYTDLFFAKYNQSGTVLMGRHLATSEARNMSLDYLNNIYIGGNFPTTSTIDFDPSTSGTFNLSGNSTTIFIAKYGVSIPTEINELQHEKEEIVLYPNPTNNTLHTNTALPFKIYDVLGNLCLQGNKSDIISIESLNSGVYFIELYSSDSIKKIRFVKE